MSNPNISELGKETRFSVENQPDNPGRKKGSKSLKTMLTELLSSQDPDGEWSKSVGGQLIRKAFKDGDMRALQEIIDRIEGKVPGTPLIEQPTHITGITIKNGDNEPSDSNAHRLPKEISI